MAAIDKVRRILNLVERLQSGRPYNARELADLLGVSHRTMFRDLRVLQKSGVPVLYDDERRGYYMPAATFLPPTDLTLQEALALLVLTHELGATETGIPFQEAARDAALKFLSNISGPLRNHLGELTVSIRARTEPRHPLTAAREHYGRLQKAIADKRKIRIRYRSLHEGQDITTLVSPYSLLYSRRSWYVIGRSSLHRAVRTFHLGRILQSSLTADSYQRPARFSLSQHFGLAWHLIREPRARRDVVIRFQPMVASNVAEVMWHSTQTTSWNEDGTLTFRVTVDGLGEISWWVLGYGDQAEVLEPLELRELIAERVRKMAALYHVDGNGSL